MQTADHGTAELCLSNHFKTGLMGFTYTQETLTAQSYPPPLPMMQLR